MITITEAGANEFSVISDIAYKTWPLTYGHILSSEQLTYMLGLFYSTDGLHKNVADGHKFILAKEEGKTLGFASYAHQYNNLPVTRIPKIYILPEAQKKGIGKKLLDEIELLAKRNGSEKLSLNVNRSNNAQQFYKKCGFTIVAQEDIELEHGYLMEDFIMEKILM